MIFKVPLADYATQHHIMSGIRLQIATFNTWHGLDHTRPLLMLPAEKSTVREERWQQIVSGLRHFMGFNDNHPSRDLRIACLQEVNPMDRRTKSLKDSLLCQLRSMEVNVGIRVGNFSYPPFLQEGLCTLWNNPVENLEVFRWVLSGKAPDFDFIPIVLPFKIPITIQLSERRAAMATLFRYHRLRFLIVNLHLHHGTPNTGEDKRRIVELKQLFTQIKPLLDRSDVCLLAGDFNCDIGQNDYNQIISEDFVELSRTKSNGPLNTWDPYGNSIAKSQADHSGEAWDQNPHQLDHIFLKTNIKWHLEMESKLIFAGKDNMAHCSDHLGLASFLNFEQPDETQADMRSPETRQADMRSPETRQADMRSPETGET